MLHVAQVIHQGLQTGQVVGSQLDQGSCGKEAGPPHVPPYRYIDQALGVGSCTPPSVAGVCDLPVNLCNT